ncbi:MAG: hypothetical protein RJB38_2315, partial [Pseudomonadota bacterium]
GKIPEPLGYVDLYHRVRRTLDAAHAEGRLKAEIMAHPELFVKLEPNIPLALLDQKHSGKKLLLITNSEWAFTQAMMSYSFDRFLGSGQTWRDLFDVVIVSARKPDFFTKENPFFEVVNDEGLLRPAVGTPKNGAIYYGGSARWVERHLGLSGDQLLYVGDHVFGDVQVTKSILRWRTALILAELDEEIAAAQAFHGRQAELSLLMEEKEELEARSCSLRIALQRIERRYGPQAGDPVAIQSELQQLKGRLEALDLRIAPLARESTELGHSIWGPLMRAGNDKSHLAFQMERYADVYTSKVSHFLEATPYTYLRSPRGSLPHDVN